MTNSHNNEEVLVFRRGEHLFHKGNRGGDLFFIQEGVIEIYVLEDSEEIHLAKMGAGEVIGILTVMTDEVRMASARAYTESTVKKVSAEKIRSTTNGFPEWMKIVLKEFTNRLGSMNSLYSKASMQLKSMQTQQASLMYTASQVANAISVCSEHIAVQIDGTDVLMVEDVVSHLSLYLRRPEEEIHKLFDLFADSGLIRLLIEQEKKKRYFSIENASKVKLFADFIDNAKRGVTKKLLESDIGHKEKKIMTGMVRHVKKLEASLESEVTLSVKELEKSMEKTSGIKFERHLLQTSMALKLIKSNENEEDEKLIFVPLEVQSAISHISAYKKIEALSEKASKE